MKLPLFICISMACAATAVAQVPPNPTSGTSPSQTSGLTSTSLPCSPMGGIQTGSVLGSSGSSMLLTPTVPPSPLSTSLSSSMSTFGSSTSSPVSSSSATPVAPGSAARPPSPAATAPGVSDTPGAMPSTATAVSPFGGLGSTTSLTGSTTPTSLLTFPMGTTSTVGLPPCPR